MKNFCDMFIFIKREIIIKMFNVNEMYLSFIKLFVQRIIQCDMSFLRELCKFFSQHMIIDVDYIHAQKRRYLVFFHVSHCVNLFDK
jgi:hypothetical protein